MASRPETTSQQVARVVSEVLVADTLMQEGKAGEAILQEATRNVSSGNTSQLIERARAVLGEGTGSPDPRVAMQVEATALRLPISMILPELEEAFIAAAMDFLSKDAQGRKEAAEKLQGVYQGTAPSKYTEPEFFPDTDSAE